MIPNKFNSFCRRTSKDGLKLFEAYLALLGDSVLPQDFFDFIRSDFLAKFDHGLSNIVVGKETAIVCIELLEDGNQPFVC